MKCLLLCLLCALPVLLNASPLEKTVDTISVADTLSSFLRVRRQSPGQCTNNTECLAVPTLSPPATLVQCFQGMCQCMQCFMLNDDGMCDANVCPDFLYNSDSNECAMDNRPRQLTAFLVSLFAGGTGAANFYIGQNGLGAGQLILLLIIVIVPYVMCCLPCCLACCVDSDNVKGSAVFIVLMIVTILLIVLASLAMSAWWIADLIIFATNQRPAANGCTLTPWS